MSQIKSRVFVTQLLPTRFDYAGLEQFGIVVPITTQADNWTVNEQGNNDRVRKRLADVLRDFDEINDYIVSTGSSAINAAVFMLLGRLGVGRFRLLTYKSKATPPGYEPMAIDIEESCVILDITTTHK
jgi:hypothetical protein